MTKPVVFAAPCPADECNGNPDAEWTAVPVSFKDTTLQGAHPVIVPKYRIRCKTCGGTK